MAEFVPKPGAMRYKGSDGAWQAANPHDALYSTVSMGAEQFWCPTRGWVAIWPEDDNAR